MVLGGLLTGVGCSKKEDPRDRPGFIDTSTEPGKVNQMMTPLPKGGKDATSLKPGGK